VVCLLKRSKTPQPRWLVFYGCLWAVVIDSVPVSGSQGWLWPEDLLACVGFLGWHEPCWGVPPGGMAGSVGPG